MGEIRFLCRVAGLTLHEQVRILTGKPQTRAAALSNRAEPVEVDWAPYKGAPFSVELYQFVRHVLLNGNPGEDLGTAQEIISHSWLLDIWGFTGRSLNLWCRVEKSGLNFQPAETSTYTGIRRIMYE